jgi:hypothetical protein
MITQIRNMTKHTKILLFLFLTLSLRVHGQEKILVGFQLGPNFGYPKGSDYNGGIYNGMEGVWGINMALVNKNGIVLETGRYKSMIDYGTDIRISGHSRAFGNNIRGTQIPLRLQKRINIIKDKIFFSPSIGLSYLYHIHPSIGNLHGSIIYGANGDTVYYSMSPQSLHKNGFLAETGAKVEFIILKYVALNISCYYSYGLHSLEETNLSYNIPAINESGKKTIITRGNNLQFFIGLSSCIYDKQRDIHNQQRRLERMNKL